MKIYRIFVEKKEGFDVQAKKTLKDIKHVLGIQANTLREILRYDVSGITDEEFEKAKVTVFSEPPVDAVFDEEIAFASEDRVFAIEYLPGQYDQRADSAAQCVQFLTHGSRPQVKCARVFAISGVNDAEFEAIKKYLINPVESREASLVKPTTLETEQVKAGEVEILTFFNALSDEEVSEYHAKMGFAMSADDLRFVRDYFISEGRCPTLTELKVIDTYWSDHCRHTTFLTELKDVRIYSENDKIEEAYRLYQETFAELYSGRDDKYECLMDIAVIAAKKLKKEGVLTALDESEEINACSIVVNAEIDGELQEWLVMFKNETHNHPTEIEPFGGAATCLGGAIRDPLSGRSYVYQAMRITGAADPTVAYSETLEGKLPQRVISKTAAAGFSSYGNQIGLATGIVHELYHPNYVAKRLETGFVVAAAPRKNVRRDRPEAGDVVVLLGGETGRDGCGGATGSSKAHTTESVQTCGAEVQKGNPLTERKLQRLFKKEKVTTLIKRCNDFGAGGVCVAIGELADGLDIDLNAVPKKYDGLNGTELAISESQERMAVVISAEDLEKFIAYADEENLDATPVAVVTDTARMRMTWNGKNIVDIQREFLNTNGVKQTAQAVIREGNADFFANVNACAKDEVKEGNFAKATEKLLANLNVTSQKGLGEIFDSTIGGSTVLMPYGGKNQLTPASVMAAKLPLEDKTTDTATVSAWGFNPYMMENSPFVGAIHSVLTSMSKLVSAGVDHKTVYLTFQEFFKKLGKDPERWGTPMSALLGAFYAQMKLKNAAIGGKDSMSGSFEQIDVPNTLISFALGTMQASKIVTNVIEKSGEKLYVLPIRRDAHFVPDFKYTNRLYDRVYNLMKDGKIRISAVVEEGGAYIAAVKSCLGNGFGFAFETLDEKLFYPMYGDLILGVEDASLFEGFDVTFLGESTDDATFTFGKETISVQDAIAAFTGTLEKVYPTTAPATGTAQNVSFVEKTGRASQLKTATPRVFIPAFPGTNCEFDTARKFLAAGAKTDIFVIRNRSANEVAESVKEIAARIKEAQIVAFPGGFSGGDEPDGSGKFIATTFRNPLIRDALEELLGKRDGLILGICNGFQALVKLGLVPFGTMMEMQENSPTLTFNNIGRHVSTMVQTRIASNKSPWLAGVNVGDVFTVPVSHGEGRFICDDAMLETLIKKGQIATQYVDALGNATMESPFNPNGSVYAIEGITSPDGRVLGKMGHSERFQKDAFVNVDGDYDMKIFESGVQYFK